MVQEQRERELKFDVGTDLRLPAAEDLVGRPVRVERDEVALTSTYYDTADHKLLRHAVTLRRREGDTDTGWHLKVPTGDARTELRLPLSAGAALPDRLEYLVRGLAAGDPLTPVAILKTTRGRSRVYDGDRALVEIAEDEVRATVLGSAAEVSTWHELEVEAVDADERLLTKIGKRLVAAGAAPAQSSSKLARAFGPSGAAQPDENSAAGLIAAYLSAQLMQIGSGDVALRRGLDPVHKTRVAVRRFRTVLRVFRAAFADAEQARRLDEQLSWYQDLLGEVRDRQVLRARFDDAVHRLPVELVLGPVAAKIDETMQSERVVALERVTTALDSERYLKLMREIDDWAMTPPMRSSTDTDDVLAMAERARRQARKRLNKAVASGEPEHLHRARKAAKRARYAIELTEPVAGKRARKSVKAHKRIQDALGEHQDSVVAAGVLLRLATAAAQPGQNGFTYGLLYEQEHAAAAEARRAARHLHL